MASSTIQSNHPISIFQVIALSVGLLALACAPEGRLPAEPEQVTLGGDDLRQIEDIEGPPSFIETLDWEQLIASAKIGVIRTPVADPPPESRRIAQAWLDPNPSYHNFTHENPFWQTFRVRTVSGLDSVYVIANPQMDGITRALETARGSEPPFRNFCPASWNDHPGRGRLNGWPLHLSACAEGTTYLILYGWSGGNLSLYNIYPIIVK